MSCNTEEIASLKNSFMFGAILFPSALYTICKLHKKLVGVGSNVPVPQDESFLIDKFCG